MSSTTAEKNTRPKATPKQKEKKTNTPTPVTGRRAIIQRLSSITIPEMQFSDLPMPEVIAFLQSEIRKRDPQKQGVNFLLQTTPRRQPAPANIAPGLPRPPPATSPSHNPEDSTVNIDPPLRGLSVMQALKVIHAKADPPIGISITDYGVVIRASSAQEARMQTRFFRANPNTFQQGLGGFVGVNAFSQ